METNTKKQDVCLPKFVKRFDFEGKSKLRFNYLEAFAFYIYAEVIDGKVKLSHGKMWDIHTNKTLLLADVPAGNYALRDAYKIASAIMKKGLPAKQLQLFEETVEGA